MRRSSSASAQSMARSRAIFARSNRIRMRARFCRSASGTWVRTLRSSTCTAWGGPYTVPEPEAVYLRGGADRRLALLALRPLTATLYRAREAMTSERVVSIIIGDSAAARPPREVVRVGLTAAVAAVLSTYRSNSPDMVLDHPL